MHLLYNKLGFAPLIFSNIITQPRFIRLAPLLQSNTGIKTNYDRLNLESAKYRAAPRYFISKSIFGVKVR